LQISKQKEQKYPSSVWIRVLQVLRKEQVEDLKICSKAAK